MQIIKEMDIGYIWLVISVQKYVKGRSYSERARIVIVSNRLLGVSSRSRSRMNE